MQKEAYRTAGDQPRMTKDLMKDSYKTPRLEYNRSAIQGKVRSTGTRQSSR